LPAAVSNWPTKKSESATGGNVKMWACGDGKPSSTFCSAEIVVDWICGGKDWRNVKSSLGLAINGVICIGIGEEDEDGDEGDWVEVDVGVVVVVVGMGRTIGGNWVGNGKGRGVDWPEEGIVVGQVAIGPKKVMEIGRRFIIFNLPKKH
jgi:hypothetical protein